MAKNKKHPKKPSKSKKSKKALETPRRLLYLLGLIPAIFAFIIYANTLDHQYALDDASAITDNYVTQKGFDGLGDVFTKHYRYGYWNSTGTLYRPVSLAMFAVEWQLSPDNPGNYHFMNVLLYALTGFLIFWTLFKLFPRFGPIFPFLVSLLFVSHPIHVEVVANIKSRDEILALLFGLLAIYSFFKYLTLKTNIWLVAALGAYTIALFSKETAITFLAVFPFVSYYVSKKRGVERFFSSAFFILPVTFYLIARYKVLGAILIKGGKISKLDNVIAGSSEVLEQKATALLLTGKYLKNLVFPHPLGSDFGFNEIPVVGLASWQVLVTILILIAIAYLAIKGLIKRQADGFGWLFFGITFSIVSNLVVLIGTSYGDRLMYVPSLGFFIAIIFYLLQGLKMPIAPAPQNLASFFQKNILPICIVGVVALLLGFKTYQRNAAWEDSYTLYKTDVENAPNSAKLNFHYGLELNKKGNNSDNPEEKVIWWDKAMIQLLRAVEIDPQYADAHAQLGLMYYRMKNYNKAMESYQLAIQYKPNNAKVYSNMGKIYFEQNNLAKAQEVYEKAVEIDPRFVDALRNLGSVYGKIRRFDDAILRFQQALKYSNINDDIALLNLYLGYAYGDKGDTAKAQQYLNKAYELNPAYRPKQEKE